MAPASGFVGFYRFLDVLALHDWTADPLVLMTPEFSAADQAKATEKFAANRASFPPMTILSIHDRTESVWTVSSPTKPITKRLVRLAKASLKVVRTCLQSPDLDAVDPRCMFRADTTV